MIKLLQCEYKKTRRRYILLSALGLTVLAGGVGLYGDYAGPSANFLLQNGYMMFLYELPLVNAIFFPLMSIIVASRLCDIEHKGANFKQICTLTSRGKLFNAKLLYGLTIVSLSVVLLWAATLLVGKAYGFGGEIPIRLYLLYLLFTLVPTAAIYMFQYSLSMLFKNQAIPFFVGILGEFAGLFSMFLPQLPWLRKSVFWGYYGALQFVGLFGWTRETRYSEAYFELMPCDWLSFAVLLLTAVVIYIIGKTLFCKKEL